MEKKGCIIAITCLLTACSSLNQTDFDSSDKRQYLKSRNGATLVVPPPLTKTNIGDFYDLPAQTQPARVSIAPPAE